MQAPSTMATLTSSVKYFTGGTNVSKPVSRAYNQNYEAYGSFMENETLETY